MTAVAPPDASAREHAVSRQARLTKPTGALGRLEEVSVWLCGVQGTCPPRAFTDIRVVVFAGDHGVARAARVSAYPPDVTAQMVLNFIRGGAAVNVLADQVGARVRVVDVAVDIEPEYVAALAPSVVAHRVRRSSGSIDREDALTPAEAEQAFALGQQIADEEIDEGADLLIAGDMGIGNTTTAAALIGTLLDVDASAVTGFGTGIDDATWMRKAAAIRDAMRRGRPHRDDALRLLATIGSADFAAAVGFLLRAAQRRTPVVLDGTITAACALVAHRADGGAKDWWVAGHRTTEPAQALALQSLGLDPIVDLQLRLGEGTGALLAVPLLQAAGALLREMATFEEAGVSDRDG